MTGSRRLPFLSALLALAALPLRAQVRLTVPRVPAAPLPVAGAAVIAASLSDAAPLPAPTTAPVVAPRRAEVYGGLSELRSAEVAGRDFRTEVRDLRAPVTVLAIHGGWIEAATSLIARAIAAEDWNLFLFEGILPAGNGRLHVTSTRFDDPGAVALTERSRTAVSVHGSRGSEEAVCVGGGDVVLRRSVARSLSEAGFLVSEPCLRFAGEDPRNLVNRAQDQGVQLEISAALRRALSLDDALLARFAAAVRVAVDARGPR